MSLYMIQIPIALLVKVLRFQKYYQSIIVHRGQFYGHFHLAFGITGLIYCSHVSHVHYFLHIRPTNEVETVYTRTLAIPSHLQSCLERVGVFG